MSSRIIVQRLVEQMRPLWRWMALSALLGVLTIASSLGLMTLSAYLISEAALHPAFSSLAIAIVSVQLLGVLRGMLRYMERLVSHDTTFRLLSRLRIWFYSKIEPLVPARLVALTREGLQDFTSGDLLSRLVADIDTLQEFYIRIIAPPIVALIIGVIMWFVLGAFNALLGLTLLAFYLLAAVGVPLLTYLLSRKMGHRIITTRSALRMTLLDSIQGVADLLAFNHEQEQMRKAQQLNKRLVSLQRRMAWIEGLREALGILLVDGCAWTMLIVAIPLVRSGRLSGVLLAVLVLATIGTFETIPPLTTAAQFLGSSLKAGQRLFDVIDTQPVVREPAGLSPTPSDYGLDIRHLSFRYPGQNNEVLSDISFSLPQGQCVALVGPSGAGKSTIANLLLRFWEYEHGSIRLGGRELRDYHQRDLLPLIGVVEQRTHLFNATIRENLLIARSDASQAEVEEAVKQANLAETVASLPQGYDTLIGEQGLKLSGGERQRLAIARAFLKGAPILIFDEATANLDTRTEHEVLLAMRRVMQGRTALLITHRLVGLDMTDEILVLQAGKIRERGTHSDLLQAEGLYWRLWQVQNAVLAAQA